MQPDNVLLGHHFFSLWIMRFETIGYHACRDNEDIDKTERDAPFKSKWKRGDDPKKVLHQPFLSEGYYFWEQDIESAHWWGNICYADKYVVFKYDISLDRERLLDLAGSPIDKKRLVTMAAQAIQQGIVGYSDPKEIPAGEVLTFVRNLMKDRFPYQAVRSVDNERSQGGGRVNLRPFAAWTNRSVPDDPQFILCLFNFSAQTLHNQTVMHPEIYVI